MYVYAFKKSTAAHTPFCHLASFHIHTYVRAFIVVVAQQHSKSAPKPTTSSFGCISGKLCIKYIHMHIFVCMYACIKICDGMNVASIVVGMYVCAYLLDFGALFVIVFVLLLL